MNQVIVITGQTATGKTSLALQLAKQHNGELINFDSRQVYKYLDIVTGKDISPNSKFTLPAGRQEILNSDSFDVGFYKVNGIKLWLYDITTPDKYFSSYDFKILAREAIEKIQNEGKIPILVGGTYLYLQHLLYGFETETIVPNWKLRNELNAKAVDELADILRSTNIQMFEQLNQSDKKNPHRLIRKIEIAYNLSHSGKRGTSASRIHRKVDSGRARMTFNLLSSVGLRFKHQQDLEKKIKKRVEERLKNGAIEEVESLLKRGYKKTDPGLLTIGYKQLINYLESKLTKQEAIDEWILREIQYAKRQYTFMKKDNNISWRQV